MSIELYLAFVAAVALLMLIPGPNVALIVATSLARGTPAGLVTVAGTSAAMVPQLAVTALGMTWLMSVLADWFEWVRWIGVAYLLWLGLREWRRPAADEPAPAPLRGAWRRLFARAFLVCLTNPKVLLFYGAFFPQFVAPGGHAGAQLALLCGSFLAVAVIVDCGWATLAGRLRPLIARFGRLRHRLTGGLLMGAGLGLALARRA